MRGRGRGKQQVGANRATVCSILNTVLNAVLDVVLDVVLNAGFGIVLDIVF